MTEMDPDRTAHVYTKAAPQPNDTFITGHLAFDETGELLCLGQKTYSHLDGFGAAAQTALRDGIADVHTQFAPATTIVHDVDVAHPALELGRLPHDIRDRIQHCDVEFTRRQQNNWPKLVRALVSQPTPAAWYTTPHVDTPPSQTLDVYIDGSHRNDSHTDHRDASTTVGFVVADDAGRIVAVSAQQLDDATESLHAEYIALKHALDAVTQVAPSAEVVVRTDNSNIVQTFDPDTDVEAPVRLRLIASYIRKALQTFADESRVIGVLRDENEFADALADTAHDTSFDYRPFEQAVEVAEAEYTYTV